MATLDPSGPGKYAPKIYADFLQFDPQKSGSSNWNILAHRAPAVEEEQAIVPRRDACAHDYTIKPNQSVVPPLDSRPDASTQYKLALLCKKCRIHVDVRITYFEATSPCPNATSQLHHFQRVSSLDSTTVSQIMYGWQCSAPTCRAVLLMAFKLPRFSDADRNLLTDTGNLKSRYNAVLADDPTREGIRQATPVDSLSRLRKYIKDSLNPEHDKRKFPANNKRFMEAYGLYGMDCKEMLERLGFAYTTDAHWTLPNPPSIVDRVNSDGGNLRELLEDVEYELKALMSKIAAENNLPNPAAAEAWSSANKDLERTLAAQGYDRQTTLRRANGATLLDPFYASLGVLSDFSDALVAAAFDRQSECDPERQPYYFECLQRIASSRSTEELQIKSTLLESSGLVSRKDTKEAFAYFDLEPPFTKHSDERVLNIFQARQPDLPLHEQENARSMLGRIGSIRGSKMLTAAAQQSIDTAEEAYTWLGQRIGPHSTDDFVTTAFAIRTDGNKDLEEKGRKAVSVIAKERQSNYLNSWLLGGDLNEVDMSVDEALRMLNIESNLSTVDGSVWPQIFANARSDRPGQQTERAITAIQKELAGNSGSTNTAPPPETWPVGLTSHGNTCYLNSLLQYYFSLKPLRDIVMEYDDYKMDTTANTEKQERVGQRKVSMKEIKGGQKFADELRHLFQRMIKDPGPSVKPEQDLVCRAFLDPKDFDELEQQNAKSESAIEDSAPTEPTTNGIEGEEHKTEFAPSNASSVTLQASPAAEDGDVHMNGGEMPPTPPDSPAVKPTDHSEKPPPLPPRRFSTTTSDTLRQAQDKAKEQQDVTEVHDSITQRLRAGMQPKGADTRGEQLDALRDLFMVYLSKTTLSDDAPTKPEMFNDSSIQLNVPTEPTTLYSALDEIFDPEEESNNAQKQQYRSINRLSPFLQINMPRIGFDPVEKVAFKSDKSLKLEDELYLDRYCDKPEVLERRRSAWGWRKELKELKKEQKAYGKTAIDLDGPTTVAQTAKYIKSLDDVNKDLVAMGEDPIDADTELHEALAADANFQVEHLKSLDAEIAEAQAKLDKTFADLKTEKYRLHAVFFHRGATTHGHYWISIHDFQNDIWRNYNDETVKEVPKSQLNEIFEARNWNHGTPTYAVYVRDDLKESHVQAVCRAPEQPHAPELVENTNWQQDVNMPDAAAPSQGLDGTVEPKNLVMDVDNDEGWAEKRPVPTVKCPAGAKEVRLEKRVDSLSPIGEQGASGAKRVKLSDGKYLKLR